MQFSHVTQQKQGTNCVTKILPNVRVNFRVRFASKPFCLQGDDSITPYNCSDNSLVLFVRFFGFVSPFWLLKNGHSQRIVYQKNPRVRKILVRNSGGGNGCADFMGA